MTDGVILTGKVGTNANIFPDALGLHSEHGATIADVTYGKGVFWKDVDRKNYNLLLTDIQTGVDFRNLPYEDDSLDGLVFDPPYMHGGKTVKKSINECYRNENTGHESVVRNYAAGILEAARCLKKKGVLYVKCQDEIESGKQRLTHVEAITLMETFGFRIADIFVLLQATVPCMREPYQKTARKNHSYLIVGVFRR
jgi:hypothetical protein|tara:strand:- start:2911 stop:3501 length:591 start_codon:yes stop_codon:yes gene_type:complete